MIGRSFCLLRAGDRAPRLLQRVVMGSREVLIWGEPWNRCEHVQRLAESFRPLGDRWPFGDVLYPGDLVDVDLSSTWVANLYPGCADLIEAHRAFFRQLYARPAELLNFPRWGFKEVRLSADDAAYLKLLFPRGRFVLLYRDPCDAWASYKAANFRSFRRWPAARIETAEQFARNWTELAEGFLSHHQDLDAFLISYNELTEDDDCIERLAAYIDAPMSRDALNHGNSGATARPTLTANERKIVSGITGDLWDRLASV